jgi:hypothetical protein
MYYAHNYRFHKHLERRRVPIAKLHHWEPDHNCIRGNAPGFPGKAESDVNYDDTSLAWSDGTSKYTHSPKVYPLAALRQMEQAQNFAAP